MPLKVKELREKHGLSQKDLADKTGIPKGRINGWEQTGSNPKAEDTEKLRQFFESLENKRSRPLGENLPVRLIPFYDTMAVGGTQVVADDTAVVVTDYELIHPGHFFGKATGALRLYGDSMYEKYPSGSILAYRDSPNWRDLIHFGQDYVIETHDGHRVCKNVQPSDKDGYILACSYNTYKNKHGIDIYRPYQIPIAMISKMSYVLGMIKFEASI